jgi:hypothetical protein
MASDDEAKFNGYYQRSVEDRQNNDRDDMVDMEHHMQDIMNKYAIPPDTPYAQVASRSGAYPAQNPNHDRDRGGYRGYTHPWQNRLSPDDQNKFNKEYTKWQESNAKNDRDGIDKHARNMEEIIERYNIPPDTPFDQIATVAGYGGHTDVRQYQGRFSPDDRKHFDKAYEHWQSDRAKRDQDDIAKDEGKMQEIMAKYNIPRGMTRWHQGIEGIKQLRQKRREASMPLKLSIAWVLRFAKDDRDSSA